MGQSDGRFVCQGSSGPRTAAYARYSGHLSEAASHRHERGWRGSRHTEVHLGLHYPSGLAPPGRFCPCWDIHRTNYREISPALLGLKTSTDKRAILDCGRKMLHFVGEGDVQLILPPKSESYPVESAPSGHLLLPISLYDQLNRAQEEREETVVHHLLHDGLGKKSYRKVTGQPVKNRRIRVLRCPAV